MTDSMTEPKKKALPGWVSAIAIAAVVKFKTVLWLAGSLVTMILSVGVFAMQDGLPYAVGLVLLILIHESGHWIWMKVLGLNPKAPMFIPGLGAFVAMTNLPTTEASRAWVALAGPLIGGLGCAVMYAIGVHTHNSWLATSSNTGFMLNVMQLIPAKPLDGGFVVDVVSRWLLIPGTILMFILAVTTGSPLLYVLAIFSLCSVWKPKPKGGAKAAAKAAPKSGPKSARKSDSVAEGPLAKERDDSAFAEQTVMPAEATPNAVPVSESHVVHDSESPAVPVSESNLVHESESRASHDSESNISEAKLDESSNAVPESERVANTQLEPTPATGWERFMIGFAYLGLIGGLAAGFIISAIEVGL